MYIYIYCSYERTSSSIDFQYIYKLLGCSPSQKQLQMQLYRDPLLKSSNLGGDRYWEEDHHKTCNNILGCFPSFLVGNPNLNLHFHYYWEGVPTTQIIYRYIHVDIDLDVHPQRPTWNLVTTKNPSFPRMPGSAQGLGAEGKCRAKRIQIWPDGRNLGAVSK